MANPQSFEGGPLGGMGLLVPATDGLDFTEPAPPGNGGSEGRSTRAIPAYTMLFPRGISPADAARFERYGLLIPASPVRSHPGNTTVYRSDGPDRWVYVHPDSADA